MLIQKLVLHNNLDEFMIKNETHNYHDNLEMK